jgi:hypothetical protein
MVRREHRPALFAGQDFARVPQWGVSDPTLGPGAWFKPRPQGSLTPRMRLHNWASLSAAWFSSNHAN